MTTKFGLKKL